MALYFRDISKLRNLKILFLTVFLCINLISAAYSKENVFIEANTFIFSGNDKKVHADGNIEILQKDIKVIGQKAEYTQDKKEITIWESVKLTYKDIVMNCNKMIVDSVHEIVYAEGDVHYLYKDIVGQSDKAIFYSKDERVLLQGNTEVKQGSDFIKGNEVLISIKDNQIKTIGRTKIKLSPEKMVK
ncbi:MAG: hypothetical protein A2X43_05615 [Candidatus Margulisbacteria bacterium GWD2_39_127]|nr:MAG: hypothetical protein A2X43_05615 [Candidatus Margulisbacteria bacterium GWD2_39_127]